MPALSIVLLLLSLLSSLQKPETSPDAPEQEKLSAPMVVPVCGRPGRHLKRVGRARIGPQFDVPTREAEVLGGKVDVDYIRYVIKPKTGGGFLELWFGPYAFNSRPDQKLLEDSVATQKRDVTLAGEVRIGVDNAGKLKTGESWRHTSIMLGGMNGARYAAPAENASLFDRIIDSVCYVPPRM